MPQLCRLLAVFVMLSILCAPQFGCARADDTTASMQVGSFTRQYIVHVPPGIGATPVPLVFFFHGAAGTALNAATRYGWEKKADTAHFIVVFPQGLPAAPRLEPSAEFNPNIWRDGRPGMPSRGVDDIAFFTQMLAAVESKYSIDKSRVYVSGFSNGAGMTFDIAAHFADQIAAIAPDASLDYAGTPPSKRPVPMLYIVGTQDPLNPLMGGPVTLWRKTTVHAPISTTIDAWCTLDGCNSVPKVLRNDHGVHAVLYGPGTDGAEVIYYTLDGMGHHWPGSTEILSHTPIGNPSNPINATDVVWDFFSGQKLQARPVAK